MFRGWLGVIIRDMLFRLRIEPTHPIEGEVAGESASVVFVGWLGLLRTLTELLEDSRYGVAPRGPGLGFLRGTDERGATADDPRQGE